MTVTNIATPYARVIFEKKANMTLYAVKEKTCGKSLTPLETTVALSEKDPETTTINGTMQKSVKIKSGT
jgi:hypothetical protein